MVRCFSLRMMKFKIRPEICASVLIACTATSLAAALNDNPYQTISSRNPFGLRAIPIAKVTEERPVPALPPLEIKLTGVARFPGRSPSAILEFFDPQTKKTDRPPPFGEGDRYNEQIQIVSIDAALGLVRINKDGAEMALDFERNGIKEGTSAPAAGQPRSPVANVPPASNPGGRLISNNGITNVLTSHVPTLTREEMLARISAQRALLQQQNSSTANILPPPPAGRTP